MTQVKSYAAYDAKSPLKPFTFDTRQPGENDLVIDIQYCGVCHSDIHQARNEWANSIFPMVPGHEIVGKVVQAGAKVKKYKVGDTVGVGCFIDSCRACTPCHDGEEQYCEKGMNLTYNSHDKDGKPTYGGYAKQIVVDENYVLTIPSNLPPDKAAPLLCAGITTYSPLKTWNIKKGDKVAVVGLGGLGHMAVKIASAMGANVTVLSTSDRKKQDAMSFGATHFLNTSQANVFTDHANEFDFMINTAAGNIDLDKYLGLLKLDGTMVVVGLPDKPTPLNAFSLITHRRRIAGSLIGGIRETQEMLDFCSKHHITPEIEVIKIDQINDAYDRMVKGDVRYRFVIDNSSLG